MSLATVHYLSMMVDAARLTVPDVVAGTSASFVFSRLPASTALTFTWGDGTTATGTTDSDGAITKTHTYPYAGRFELVVTVTSGGKVVETDEVFATVDVTVAADILAGVESGDFDLILRPDEDFTVDWGDDEVEEFTADEDGLATLNHTYATGGDYTISVKDLFGNEVASEEVTVTDTFTLTFSGQTTSRLAFDADGSDVDAALTALSNIGATDVDVTGSAGGPYEVTFVNGLAATNEAQITASSTGDAITITTDTAGVAPVNEVQTLTVNATGGTFTLTYSGQTTSDLAFDITGADLQTALIALSNIGPGDVAVTGDGPYTITFDGALAGTNVSTITADSASLTGGTHTASIQVDTQGVAAVNEVQTITLP